MATLSEKAAVDADGEDYTILERETGHYLLVFGHIEHWIDFTDVEIERNSIEFFRSDRGRTRTRTGGVEALPALIDFFESWDEVSC